MGASKQVYYETHSIKPAVGRWYWDLAEPVGNALDLGCGTGELGAFAPDGVRVSGVDHDAEAVREGSRWEDARQVDLEHEPLPFEDGSFSSVIARDIFEHLHNAEQLLCEVHRVLRPGGKLVVSVVQQRPKRLWADYTHVRGYTAKSTRMFLEDAGFQVEKVWPMGGVPYTARLGLVRFVPVLLRIPPFGALFASSWEAKACKR